MTSTRKRLFAVLGITVAVAVVSHFLGGDSNAAIDISYYIFWGLPLVCLTTIGMGLLCLSSGRRELGLWLVFTPAIAAPMFYFFVVFLCGQ